MSRTFVRADTEYLYCAQSAVTTTPLSMCCWVNISDVTNDHFVLAVSDGDGSDYWAIDACGACGSDVCRALTYGSGGLSAASSTAGYSANTWHHITGVFSAANSRVVYLDGGNKGSNAVGRATAGISHFSIGGVHCSGTKYPTDGRIAEAAIWSAALTDAEAAILAAGYSPLFVRPESLVAYWPLVRDQDYDVVGGHNMSSAGTPTIGIHAPMIYPMFPPPTLEGAGENGNGNGNGGTLHSPLVVGSQLGIQTVRTRNAAWNS